MLLHHHHQIQHTVNYFFLSNFELSYIESNSTTLPFLFTSLENITIALQLPISRETVLPTTQRFTPLDYDYDMTDWSENQEPLDHQLDILNGGICKITL